jgi:hypothetical protein
MALVLEMPSQHLDGLSVRREEAIVLRRETLGEELYRVAASWIAESRRDCTITALINTAKSSAARIAPA